MVVHVGATWRIRLRSVRGSDAVFRTNYFRRLFSVKTRVTDIVSRPDSGPLFPGTRTAAAAAAAAAGLQAMHHPAGARRASINGQAPPPSARRRRWLVDGDAPPTSDTWRPARCRRSQSLRLGRRDVWNISARNSSDAGGTSVTCCCRSTATLGLRPQAPVCLLGDATATAAAASLDVVVATDTTMTSSSVTS